MNSFQRLYFMMFYAAICGMFSSCSHKPQLPKSLLTGEWHLDSIYPMPEEWKQECAWFPDTNTFWSFSYEHDHYILDSALEVHHDSIFQKEDFRYTFWQVDTNRLIITRPDKQVYYYRKGPYSKPDDFKERLAEFQTGDSIRPHIRGWWKLIHAAYIPVRLFNYPGQGANELTIQFKDNGRADMFVNNDTGEIADYYWHGMKDDIIGMGIFLHRYCLRQSIPVYMINQDTLKIGPMDRVIDSLIFVRTQPLR
ncbi:hypothetical protein D3C72_772560 [compost metagenome]